MGKVLYDYPRIFSTCIVDRAGDEKFDHVEIKLAHYTNARARHTLLSARTALNLCSGGVRGVLIRKRNSNEYI